MNITISEYASSQFQRMNKLGDAQIPFLFVIDFELQKPEVIPIEDLPQHNVLFDIDGYRNYSMFGHEMKSVQVDKYPIDYHKYKESFDIVHEHLSYGNSFLVNLTHPTKIHLNLDLLTLFYQSTAKYKLLYDDQFLVFSPEIFVKITDGVISSNPMKGTIDKKITDAEKKILNDPKELAEHVTIVDLIRNDLSRIASDVKVNRFRYVDEIKTHEKELLQISSEISGVLPENYASMIGDILLNLLPAGSVSGAPKKKTMEIIKESEKESRGYYTGIVGYFNGKVLDSGVMIRYIEKKDNDLVFRSGGGITVNSDPRLEYQEMIDKVYVPFA